MAEPIRGYVFTEHAVEEMRRRGLSEELVCSVLERPDQRFTVRPGRVVVQTRVAPPGSSDVYLMRVFVDVDREPPEVVTTYRTRKVEKYWRLER